MLIVPAIPGEGRALFDAVVAQGLAGVLARHRSGPYLPGVRSRLWKFIPATADGAAPTRVAGDEAMAEAAAGHAASAPVLAVIRRLPLGLDDLDPRPDDPPKGPFPA